MLPNGKDTPDEQNFEDEDLFAFLNDDEETTEENSNSESFEDEDLFAFLNDDDDPSTEGDLLSAITGENSTSEEEDDEEDTTILGSLLGMTNTKPEPLLPFKHEKRKARLDITKNSSEDHRSVKRYTKKELNDQLVKDYRYMMGKSYMMIQPVTIMADYPYKKKKSDSDIEDGKKNVEEDYVLVIGKLQKWRGTEQFRGKAYKLGHIMYVRKGDYWIDGKEIAVEPHFAIVLHKTYKRIKSKRIRDLLSVLKHRLRTGKPFTIYKEFPMIVKRTGVYS